ncbi:MAG: nuclear transport factor 2 family protein [Saprospiraceae bacterium]|nr:nuclear transport factor 2 family protein [Saprospiraceae bacterium]
MLFASAQTDGDIETLRYLKEVEWPKAYRDQDTTLLDRILAEEFQMIDDQGNWFTKEDELAYIKKHKPTYHSFRYEIKRMDLFENLTAVISGIGHIKSKDEQGAYMSTYHSSNVLIKRQGTWKAISSHVSGIEKVYDPE